MDNSYHTVRMSRAPLPGDVFHSLYLDPAPAPDKWWVVPFAPVGLVSGGFAVTLQECAGPVTKGSVGEKVHSLLRSAPPEPTLGMIYAEVRGVSGRLERLERQIEALRATGEMVPFETVRDRAL